MSGLARVAKAASCWPRSGRHLVGSAWCGRAIVIVPMSAWMGQWVGVGCLSACANVLVTCKRFKLISIILNYVIKNMPEQSQEACAPVGWAQGGGCLAANRPEHFWDSVLCSLIGYCLLQGGSGPGGLAGRDPGPPGMAVVSIM